MNVSMEYELVRDIVTSRCKKAHRVTIHPSPPQPHQVMVTPKGACDVTVATLIDFNVEDTYASMFYVLSATSIFKFVRCGNC